MPTASWHAMTEIYNADGWERTIWQLRADTGEVLEQTRHPFRLPDITAQWREGGWHIVAAA